MNALSAFSWLSIRSRRQQQGSLIWRRGACALYLWPHSEPGASERLLSAWSVLINIPSSRVMINANPIGCASDENPVSQNEVRLGLPRQSPSHRDCTQSSGEATPQRSIKHERGPVGGWRGWFLTDVSGSEMAFSWVKNNATRNYEWRKEIHQLLVQLKCKHLDIWWPKRLKSVVWRYFSFKYTHSQEDL